MRSLVIFAALAASMSFSGRALADKDADLDRCKFAGELGKAVENIAACDRVINDPKTTVRRLTARARGCRTFSATTPQLSKT